MKYRIRIDGNRCKTCELCGEVCPKKIMAISAKKNELGFNIAECTDEGLCIGCLACALVCPDAAIEIFQEEEE